MNVTRRSLLKGFAAVPLAKFLPRITDLGFRPSAVESVDPRSLVVGLTGRDGNATHYRGYRPQLIERSPRAWAVLNGSCTNRDPIVFPENVGGAVEIAGFTISGGGSVLAVGLLLRPIYLATNSAPMFGANEMEICMENVTPEGSRIALGE